MVIFWMPLEIDKPKTIFTGCQMDTGVVTFHQDIEVGRVHLLRINFVPT